MNCQIKSRDKVIDDYIMGVMPKSQKEAFEEHCFYCDECFQDLKLKEEAVGLIKDEGESIFAQYLKSKRINTKQPRYSNIFVLPQILSRRLPTFAFAAVFFIALMMGSYYFINRSNSLVEYPVNFDNTLPIQYGQSSLRGGSENFRNDAMYNIFNNQYLAGISDYINCDYASAITTWKKVGSIALNLEKQTRDQELLLALRNYYFYMGVSHLAISVSQKIKLNDLKREEHGAEAIHYLSNADSLSTQFQFENNDRETYYLGMAYGLVGDKTKSLNILKGLTRQSVYYEKANELISRWESN